MASSNLLSMLPGQPPPPQQFDTDKKRRKHLKDQMLLAKQGLDQNRHVHIKWNYDLQEYELNLCDKPTTLIKRIIGAITRIWSDAVLQHVIWNHVRNIEAILKDDKISLKERNAFRKKISLPTEECFKMIGTKMRGIYCGNLSLDLHENTNLYNSIKSLPDNRIFKLNRYPIDISLQNDDFLKVEYPLFSHYSQAIFSLENSFLKEIAGEGVKLKPSDRIEFSVVRREHPDVVLFTTNEAIGNSGKNILIRNIPSDTDLLVQTRIIRRGRELASKEFSCKADFVYNHMQLKKESDAKTFKKLPIPLQLYPEFEEGKPGLESIDLKKKIANLKYTTRSKKLKFTLDEKKKKQAAVVFENTSTYLTTVSARVYTDPDLRTVPSKKALGLCTALVMPKSSGSIKTRSLAELYFQKDRTSADERALLGYRSIHTNIFTDKLR